jgi:hypothetical protein
VYEVISNNLLPFTTLKVEPIDQTHDTVKVIFGELGGIDLEFVWEQKNTYKLVEENTGLTEKTIKKLIERLNKFISTDQYDMYVNTLNPDNIIITVNCYAYGISKILIMKTETGTYNLSVTISNSMIELEKIVSGLAEHCMEIFREIAFKDKDTIVIRLVPRHTFTLFNEAKKDGKELKISICIGAPVEAMVSAALSVDFGTDELTIASAMHKKGHGTPLKVSKCDNGLFVPADCEYVFEGRITAETCTEGPFVDIAGTYDEVRDQPVIKIDKIWAKKDPVFQLLLPGGYEHFLLMGVPREPVIFKTVRQAVPKVKNVRLTEGGCCWLNGVVSISKNKEGDAVNAIMAAFTGHPSMKSVIIVDDDIDIFDDREVEWAVATRMQADKIIKIPGAAGSSLDPSAHGTTWKVGYDATIPVGADRAPFVKATLPPKE